jgi:hypothetical protein
VKPDLSFLMSNSTPEDFGFTFRKRKNGDVEVLHQGRIASTLRGADALALLEDLRHCSVPEAQQLMAQITGNYKRGNERLASSDNRNRA